LGNHRLEGIISLRSCIERRRSLLRNNWLNVVIGLIKRVVGGFSVYIFRLFESLFCFCIKGFFDLGVERFYKFSIDALLICSITRLCFFSYSELHKQ